MQRTQAQQRNFSNYLANVQTAILRSSFRTLGAEWSHSNLKLEYNLLYYMVSGRCKIWIDGSILVPTAGQLVLLPAGSIISASSYDGEVFGKYYCHFTSLIGDNRLFDLLSISPIIEVDDHVLIEEQFQHLNESYTGHEMTSILRAKTTLAQLLCYVIENSPARIINDAGHRDVQSITRVLEYMQLRLSHKLSVDELAKLAHFHPRYFISVFKSMTGFSPMQYIAKLRYDRACSLLRTTNLSMNKIADRIGILPDYFTKFFKHHSGVSPTSYREFDKRT
ncbi:helix-turn-helix transcriptional regulator [Paenibacillus hemerocallicola]|jgi:AraC-like DNA-binding protein|uniref:Helix-turn-helix transcriptional regulator n=1 Tax=Paenibacillus hemerocallicola TaxID=1172614 RepID=A0A5C4TBC2_9BACL|nr:AraC family transcriptional regulator [Paenibacillus hemerocallicola]TNJ65946.1 helix-turn-helix transcriptional regulator [Paenibacillus hemerocallicola]